MKGWERVLAELNPDADWERLKEASLRALNAMTPVARAAMYEAQRLDFAYGNVKLHNPMLTREMMQDVVDKIDGVVRSDT